MKISFHGAARTVTGSKHLLTLKNGKKVLLDCGMFQGMGKETDPLNRRFGFNPVEVDALILSHAHIDHSGLIPRLVKEGFRGKIFCTHPTKDLAAILLQDSAEIQQNDIKFSNKRKKVYGKQLLEPLYEMKDATASLTQFVSKDYGEWFQVFEDVEAHFTDAGHILGSACVHLRIKEDNKLTTLTFSGDVGRYRDVILKSPQVFPQADFIIMESTYGDSLHESVSSSIDHLLEWVQKICVEKKGKLIIPAFSLGRTQEVLFALNQLELEKRLPDVDYFLDSPLSVEITDVIKNHTHYFNKVIQKIMLTDHDPFSFNGLKHVRSIEESKSLNYRNGPMVIISASGMAEAGRVKHHISNNIENSNNGILLTGYCEPNSLGGRLMAGAKEVGIFGVLHQVHAEVGSIKSMSAHGDFEDLSQWLACQNKEEVKKIFLVHGEYEVQEAFKARLIKKGYADVHIPSLNEQVSLV